MSNRRHPNLQWDLVAANLKPATYRNYRHSLHLFCLWCINNYEAPSSIRELDYVLTDYIHDIYAEHGSSKAGRSLAQKTVAAVQFFYREARGELDYAHAAISGWAKLHPSLAHPPLSWELTVAIAMRLVECGHWRDAIGTMLAFDCLLRVGELVGLHREDVAFAGDDPRVGGALSETLLRLRSTKTGPDKSVTVQHPALVSLLRVLVDLTPPTTRLLNITSTTFRRHFKRACADLGLPSAVVPHSLRHGGATHLMLRHVPVEDIMLRGRWAVTTTARHYIQAGPARLLAVQVTSALAARARILTIDIVSSFTHSLLSSLAF